ncbi:hypothetical protein HAX54_040276 [Datura stramonium]|uniref:Uncharacterized protein n=1 Tax=Datura stramonium TaxID=4076 RepID=A0ABS8SK94_DATST|nr:hypothetical protein [Datura stramonium]
MEDFSVCAWHSYSPNALTPSSMVEEVHFESSVGQKEKFLIDDTSTDALNQTSLFDSPILVASLLRLGPLSVSGHEKELIPNNVIYKGSERKQQEVSVEEGPDVATESFRCRRGKSDVKSQSIFSNLISSQEKSNAEVEKLTGLLAQRDAKIVLLKTTLQYASTMPVEGSGPMEAFHQENEELKLKVGDLTQKLLQAHDTAK